jgi:hypothetical protein
LFQRFRKNSLTSEKKEQSLVPGEVEELFIGSTVRWRNKRIQWFLGKSKKEEDSTAVPGEVEERRGFTGSRGSRRKKRIQRFQGKSKKEEDSPVLGEVEGRRGFVSEKIEEWCVEKVEKDVSKVLYLKVSRQG